MRLKTIVPEDFTNYKVPSMFIGTVACDGKCCKEAGIPVTVCQNHGWLSSQTHVVSDRELCQRYLGNPITKAVVFGGLEPFEQYHELCRFLNMFREVFGCDDDVVIYTGFNKDEIKDEVEHLAQYKNIIIKFGRFKPNEQPHFDEVLGVNLASSNQYGERIS